jgi:GPH family glycoside/pentoside/hexuronide:cation symporter
MNFYFQYNVDQKSLYDFMSHFISLDFNNAYSVGFSAFNMMGAVVQFVGVICLSRYLANKFGKKKAFKVCLTMTAFSTALFYIPEPTDVGLLFLINFLRSLAYAPTIPLLWAMIGDVADHIEYESHRRATGFCFSGIVFALKMGLGLGGALTGVLLSAFGYIPGDVAAQPASAVVGIRLAVSLVPALLFGLATLTIAFYPITTTVNKQMQHDLDERRNAIAD